MPRRRPKRRGRRRRNERTQRPVVVTRWRTGTGGTTELEESAWLRPPTGWDVTALAMRTQADKAKRLSEKRAKKVRKASRENRREAKAERWRARFRKPGASPFNLLPGMASRVESGRAAPPVIPDTERRRAGMASRGSPTTLTTETASTVLELRAEGLSYREIGQRTGHPATTIGHWLRTGRASAVSKGRGQ